MAGHVDHIDRDARSAASLGEQFDIAAACESAIGAVDELQSAAGPVVCAHHVGIQSATGERESKVCEVGPVADARTCCGMWCGVGAVPVAVSIQMCADVGLLGMHRPQQFGGTPSAGRDGLN